MNAIQIILTAFLFALQAVCFKLFSNCFNKTLTTLMLHSCLYLSTAALLLFCFSGFSVPTQPESWVLGSACGICLAISLFCVNRAYALGSMSVCSLIISGGICVPILTDAVFLGKPVSTVRLLILCLLFLSFYVASEHSFQSKERTAFSFFLYCFLGLLFNGLMMAAMSIYQSLAHNSELSAFMALALAAAAAVHTLALLLLWSKHKSDFTFSLDKKYVAIMIILALSTALGNWFNLALAGRLPAAILFPTVVGGGVVLNSLCSRFLFHEQISHRQSVGIGLCFLSLCLLNIV